MTCIGLPFEPNGPIAANTPFAPPSLNAAARSFAFSAAAAAVEATLNATKAAVVATITPPNVPNKIGLFARYLTNSVKPPIMFNIIGCKIWNTGSSLSNNS